MKTKLGLSDFFLLLVVGILITFIGFAITDGELDYIKWMLLLSGGLWCVLVGFIITDSQYRSKEYGLEQKLNFEFMRFGKFQKKEPKTMKASELKHGQFFEFTTPGFCFGRCMYVGIDHNNELNFIHQSAGLTKYVLHKYDGFYGDTEVTIDVPQEWRKVESV